MAKLIITIPAQEWEVDIEDEDYEEWAQDPQSSDPLYDTYIHHYIEDIDWKYEVVK